MNTIKILWTGGFDSTFRIAELSRTGCIIQPYYLTENRASEAYELNAISEITRIINAKKMTKSVIKDPIILSTSDITKHDIITNVYKSIRNDEFFGSQYEWLARLAFEHQGLELSIHKDDKAINIINKYGKVKKVTDGIISYYVIDKEKSKEDINLLFSNFHFPLLELTKIQMKKLYEEWDMQDVAEATWFCHTPINNKPCGKCNPCIYTIEEGMAERFSKDAIKRYKFKKIKIFMKKTLLFNKALYFFKKSL